MREPYVKILVKFLLLSKKMILKISIRNNKYVGNCGFFFLATVIHLSLIEHFTYTLKILLKSVGILIK